LNAPANLTNCDEEPIHIPGSIQPHGVLLALRDGVVVVASANAAEGVLGGCIEELVTLEGAAWADLLAPEVDYSAVNPLEGSIGGIGWNVILHRSADLIVV
jgi:light-regulated signal transduction histidine kinase (bacteriophytochrome)